MNRRKFFAFLPAAPVAIVSWPADATPKEAPPENSVTMILNGTMKESGECMRLTDGISINNYPKNDPMKQVSMAVGQDGHLWIKPKDGVWKRVVTE